MEVHQLHFRPGLPQHHRAAGQMRMDTQHKKDQETQANTRGLHCHRITNALFATLFWPTRRSLPHTLEATMRSNLHQIPMTQQVRPKFTTVASVERCCLLSVLWTDTCLSILVSVLSPVKGVGKHSLPMETCIDIRGLMESEIHEKVMEAAELAPMEVVREVVLAANARPAWSKHPHKSAPLLQSLLHQHLHPSLAPSNHPK